MSDISGHLHIKVGELEIAPKAVYRSQLPQALIDEELYVILGKDFTRPIISDIIATQETGEFVHNFNVVYLPQSNTKLVYKLKQVVDQKGYIYNSHKWVNHFAASVTYVPYVVDIFADFAPLPDLPSLSDFPDVPDLPPLPAPMAPPLPAPFVPSVPEAPLQSIIPPSFTQSITRDLEHVACKYGSVADELKATLGKRVKLE